MESKTSGKICGAVGLLLLLGSAYTYLLLPASVAGAQALVGAVLIGIFFATNYGQLGRFASDKSHFFYAATAVMTLLLIGALVAVNFISAKRDKTWDLTRKKIYSLAPQTVSTLHGLKDKVKAIGFLPPSAREYGQLESFFERYHREAPDKFEYVFEDPKKNPRLAEKYQLKEGQATVVLTRGEGDKESHTALNVISEQELTNALIKMNSVGEQKVYFIAGHGEFSLDRSGDPQSEGDNSISEWKRSLGQEGYTAEALNLAGKTEVPKDAALVVIAGSRSKLAEPEIAALKKYMDEGGRMLFFADPQAETGLDKLLGEFGVEFDKGIVADDRFAVNSPYVVLSKFYGEHEITKLLRQLDLTLIFPESRGLTVIHQGLDPSVSVTPIVLTSPFAWVETTPDDNPKLSDGEKSGQIPLVVASTKNTSVAKDKRYDEARLVVFGSSSIVLDPNWAVDPNRQLVMNAVAWGTQQGNKITIRPPDRDISTIDLDDDTLSKIRFVAIDLFPLSLLSLGLAIWITRRNK